MKFFSILLFCLLFAFPAFAQDENAKYGAFGLGLSQEVDGSVLGWGALGIPLTERSVSFTSFDVFSADETGSEFSILGYRLRYTVRTGAAYKLVSFGERVSIFGLGDIGIATDGEVVSGSYAGGGFLNIKLNDTWGFMAVLQADHNNIDGTDFKPRFGVNVKF